MADLSIFGLGMSRGFSDSICEKLGVAPASVTEEWRPDGEPWAAADSNVRGHDVFVVSSLYSDRSRSSNDKFTQLAFFVDALKRASAARVTAVCPYLPYMRQDRKEGSREPVSTQARAKILEAVGVDRVLTMDAHNPAAEQNAFRIPVDILEAKKRLADAVAAEATPRFLVTDCHPPWVVMTPDAGGVKRAKAFQSALEWRLGQAVGFAHADKVRSSATAVRTEIIGPVDHANVIVVDDMIATGATIREIDAAVRGYRARVWGVVATHGLFVGDAPANLAGIDRLFIAHTAEPWRLEGSATGAALREVGVAGMFAQAIRRIHDGNGSISELLAD